MKPEELLNRKDVKFIVDVDKLKKLLTILKTTSIFVEKLKIKEIDITAEIDLEEAFKVIPKTFSLYTIKENTTRITLILYALYPQIALLIPIAKKGE